MIQLKVKIKVKCRIDGLKGRIFFLFAEWSTSFVVKSIMYLQAIITHTPKMEGVLWQP